MIEVFEQFSTTFKNVMQSLPTRVLSGTCPSQIGAPSRVADSLGLADSRLQLFSPQVSP